MKLDLYIEAHGNKVEHKVLIEKLKEFWKADGNKVKDLKEVEMYYKPEENTCYYIINGDVKGSINL